MYFTYHPTPSLAIENLYTNQIILRRVINVQVLLTWFEWRGLSQGVKSYIPRGKVR